MQQPNNGAAAAAAGRANLQAALIADEQRKDLVQRQDFQTFLQTGNHDQALITFFSAIARPELPGVFYIEERGLFTQVFVSAYPRAHDMEAETREVIKAWIRDRSMTAMRTNEPQRAWLRWVIMTDTEYQSRFSEQLLNETSAPARLSRELVDWMHGFLHRCFKTVAEKCIDAPGDAAPRYSRWASKDAGPDEHSLPLMSNGSMENQQGFMCGESMQKQYGLIVEQEAAFISKVHRFKCSHRDLLEFDTMVLARSNETREQASINEADHVFRTRLECPGTSVSEAKEDYRRLHAIDPDYRKNVLEPRLKEVEASLRADPFLRGMQLTTASVFIDRLKYAGQQYREDRETKHTYERAKRTPLFSANDELWQTMGPDRGKWVKHTEAPPPFGLVVNTL